jgi:KDO2-lipid IV(A) lauroyltransferase
VGIGKPLSSKFWDKKLNELRARFGMRIINHTNVNKCLTEWKNERLAILTLSDQSPGDSKKSFWTTFLHQPTAVLFGAELLANQYDMAVVFFHLKKIKRGHYSISLELITDAPRKEEYGYITLTHTQKLEQIINDTPQFWLWSHKRWKREIPENLQELQQLQRKNFEAKFRSK